jgi:hypothetical protein
VEFLRYILRHLAVFVLFLALAGFLAFYIEHPDPVKERPALVHTKMTRADVELVMGGRQFVLDHEGKPIYGVWIYIPEPDPIIIPENYHRLRI